ncbi:ABC transporter ATP-binding protein [Pseudidiomarina woesei]|uniref:ABC-type cobalamin/Fe3+-siderophores transport system, ATPase component n=1 Tax=Pseudidiomarina woesei TaxID=1381080 RepID=A0A0K6HBJ3_9GAMM|nr:ABC transporter ATP-binding protein [Pseudidiomarina woesei]CUA88369.1 ABC-type cobalamin/Fe3+-siderophores transport system, ATPase component [Pseudidiomarina woesei]
MLEVVNLNISNRLSSLSVSVPSGQLVGVIGPNGAGKSTLLKAIAGLTHIEQGQVEYEQTDLRHYSAYKRRQLLSYLPQFSQFNEPVTVAELLQLSQMNIRASSAELARWQKNAMKSFQLDNLSNRPITELSGGEQRRVAIACMATGNRSLMLLDEPVSGLDLYYQLLTMDWLRSRVKQGATVVIALHDLALAAQYCDQILMLDKGEAVAFGDPNDVLSDTNLAHTFQVSVDWLCNDNGVAMLASRLKG